MKEPLRSMLSELVSQRLRQILGGDFYDTVNIQDIADFTEDISEFIDQNFVEKSKYEELYIEHEGLKDWAEDKKGG